MKQFVLFVLSFAIILCVTFSYAYAQDTPDDLIFNDSPSSREEQAETSLDRVVNIIKISIIFVSNFVMSAFATYQYVLHMIHKHNAANEQIDAVVYHNNGEHSHVYKKEEKVVAQYQTVEYDYYK